MTIYRCVNLYVIMLTYKSDLQTFHTEKELVITAHCRKHPLNVKKMMSLTCEQKRLPNINDTV